MADSATAVADAPCAVVFDLGGVLIDWNPRYLYRRLIADEATMERFLAEVVSPAWNREMDRGRPFAELAAELVGRYPDHAALIAAYRTDWLEMLGEAYHDTVEVLAELRANEIRLLALTNWSAETFVLARPRYPFLSWFEDVLVSGEVGLIKPDPAIFRLLVDRHGLEASRTVFVDDAIANVEAAAGLGFRAIRFTAAPALRRELAAMGVLHP